MIHCGTSAVRAITTLHHLLPTHKLLTIQHTFHHLATLALGTLYPLFNRLAIAFVKVAKSGNTTAIIGLDAAHLHLLTCIQTKHLHHTLEAFSLRSLAIHTASLALLAALLHLATLHLPLAVTTLSSAISEILCHCYTTHQQGSRSHQH